MLWLPEYKDWNEDLKAKYGVNITLAKEHLKLEELTEICKELYETCKYSIFGNNLDAVLLESYEKLKSIMSDLKVSILMHKDRKMINQRKRSDYLDGIHLKVYGDKY